LTDPFTGLLQYVWQYRYSISVSTLQYHDAVQNTDPTINACRLATNRSLFQLAVQLFDLLFGTVTSSVPLTTYTQYSPAHPPRSKQPRSGAGRQEGEPHEQSVRDVVMAAVLVRLRQCQLGHSEKQEQ